MSSDWGLKISLPGFDVKTCTPEQCSLHSSYPCPKIETNHSGYTLQKSQVLEILTNPAKGTSTNLLTINHPYAYAPMATGTWFYEFGLGHGPEYGQLPLGLNLWDTIVIYTTTSQMKIDYVRANIAGIPPDLSGVTFTVRWTIFVESGA